MTAVVDTNVAVVANRRSPQASMDCILSCVESLEQMVRQGQVVLDDRWAILSEYMRYLSRTGQPGVGDAFLKWILTNLGNRDRCELVSITPVDGDSGSFHEFPMDPALANFDPSDRKFVAVARAHSSNPPILQAVDWEWWTYRDLLKSHGVEIRFLCGGPGS